tara:strand:+ start:326 stop:748 length:423 start_codon:yes stop_codon:yes gene_type:complete
MIAVLNIDGRQLRVEKNAEFYVNKLTGKKGDKLTLDTVSLVDDGKAVIVGKPLVQGANVKISILEQTKGEKIIVFKKKRRKGYKVKNGHRQMLTKIKIEGISISKKTAQEKEVTKTTAKKTTAKKTTAKKTTAKKTTVKK